MYLGFAAVDDISEITSLYPRDSDKIYDFTYILSSSNITYKILLNMFLQIQKSLSNNF